MASQRLREDCCWAVAPSTRMPEQATHDRLNRITLAVFIASSFQSGSGAEAAPMDMGTRDSCLGSRRTSYIGCISCRLVFYAPEHEVGQISSLLMSRMHRCAGMFPR